MVLHFYNCMCYMSNNSCPQQIADSLYEGVIIWVKPLWTYSICDICPIIFFFVYSFCSFFCQLTFFSLYGLLFCFFNFQLLCSYVQVVLDLLETRIKARKLSFIKYKSFGNFINFFVYIKDNE